MQDIRNLNNRLVCRVDGKTKTVEIVIKGCKTIIKFNDNGVVEVKNDIKNIK